MAVKGEEYGLSHQTNYLAYTWVLKDFSKVLSEYKRPGAGIRSKAFEPGKESVAQIYLSLYPGGESEDNAEYVSIFASSGGLRKEVVYEKCILTMKASDGNVICRRKMSYRVVNVGTGRGFSTFVKSEELLEKLTVDDVLVVLLEMTYSLTIGRNRSGVVKDIVERSPFFAAREDFLSAVDSGKHSDVRIRVQGTEIPAHRFVLAARSKVFDGMFDHDVLENSTGKLDITDFDADTVRSMLSFMYSGTVQNIGTPLALELLRAADKYDVSGLRSFCSYFMISHMDGENVFKVLISAYTYNAEELLRGVIDYICDKNNPVDFEECESMLAEHPKVFVKLLGEMRKKL